MKVNIDICVKCLEFTEGKRGLHAACGLDSADLVYVVMPHTKYSVPPNCDKKLEHAVANTIGGGDE